MLKQIARLMYPKGADASVGAGVDENVALPGLVSQRIADGDGFTFCGKLVLADQRFVLLSGTSVIYLNLLFRLRVVMAI